MRIFDEDRNKLQEQITAGMKHLLVKYGARINETSKGANDGKPMSAYQMHLLSDLPGKTVEGVIANGGITPKTLLSIGMGCTNYRGCPLSISLKVYRDMLEASK